MSSTQKLHQLLRRRNTQSLQSHGIHARRSKVDMETSKAMATIEKRPSDSMPTPTGEGDKEGTAPWGVSAASLVAAELGMPF